MCKEEAPPEHHVENSSLVKEEPEPPHIKEEQEELLLRPEEWLASLAVKSEDDAEEDVARTLTEHMTTQAEDCGTSQPASAVPTAPSSSSTPSSSTDPTPSSSSAPTTSAAPTAPAAAPVAVVSRTTAWRQKQREATRKEMARNMASQLGNLGQPATPQGPPAKKRKDQLCHQCGNPKTKQYGHSQLHNVHFCSSTDPARRSVEQWRAEMKRKKEEAEARASGQNTNT